MKIFLKFIFLLSLFSGIFLSQLQANEVAPKTKIYFVKARLDKVVSVNLVPVNRKMDLLLLSVVGPSSQEYKNFEWTEIIPYNSDGTKKIFFIHEETMPGESDLLQKALGKTFEGVALKNLDLSSEKKLSKKELESPLQIYFPPLKKEQPLYLNFSGIELKPFYLPSSALGFLPIGSRNDILPALKSFFDFFEVKGVDIFIWRKNPYIPFMIDVLHSVDSKEAVNMAFEYDLENIAWSRNWLKLPGMFDDLVARCCEKVKIDNIAFWLWDISSEKAFLVIQEKTKITSIRSSLFANIMEQLAYPQMYDYIFSEYEKWSEEDKLYFLRFSFKYTYVYDEYVKSFILKETENVKNKYTHFDDFIRKDDLLKSLQKINEVFSEREKQNLYDLKTLAAFSIKNVYNIDQEDFINGLRLKAEGQIKYNSGNFLEVVVQAGSYKISFKLPLTTEQEALFKDKKAGDTVAFEGIIDDLNSSGHPNEALITLSHVLIPPSVQ